MNSLFQCWFTAAGVSFYCFNFFLTKQWPQCCLGGLHSCAVDQGCLEAVAGGGALNHAVLRPGAAVAGAGGRGSGRCLRVPRRVRRWGRCRYRGRGTWSLSGQAYPQPGPGVTRGGCGVHNTVLLLQSPPQPSPERSSWLLLRPLLLLLLLLVHV